MKQSNSTAAPSLLAADLIVTGTITSEGDIQIDGHVEGQVRARSVIIGERASVDGEIVADVLAIRGRAHGILQSRTLHLSAGARVDGELIQEILTVESGAHLEGSVRHLPRPLPRDVAPAESEAPLAIGMLATAVP